MLVGSASTDFVGNDARKTGGSEGTPGLSRPDNRHDKQDPEDYVRIAACSKNSIVKCQG
jgi:hypothetical protein